MKWDETNPVPQVIRLPLLEAIDFVNSRPSAGAGGSDEWYTPRRYIELAREVMGSIDLDPASNPFSNLFHVRARTYFSKRDASLERPWAGNVWMNPPYSRGLMMQFCIKLEQEVQAGRVKQAIVLTHANTDPAWFERLARLSSCICFTRGRIRFLKLRAPADAPPKGQAFFYVGPHPEKFAAAFQEIGTVVIPSP